MVPEETAPTDFYTHLATPAALVAVGPRLPRLASRAAVSDPPRGRALGDFMRPRTPAHRGGQPRLPIIGTAGEPVDTFILPATRPAEARLRRSGVSVSALVAYADAVGGDLEQVARDYEISPEEVAAAFAYYKDHKDAIDAKITLNRA